MALQACMNLMRRLPPADIEGNLNSLSTVLADDPDVVDELLQRVDQPLQEATDASCGRQYLLCEYCRDGDSYRSPWSNVYDPPLADGYLPREELRRLEIDANELLDAYREVYYEGGVSSVYLWDLEGGDGGDGGGSGSGGGGGGKGGGGGGGGFAGVFLIRHAKEGCSWESTHVVQVLPEGGGKRVTYKLNTTVMLSIKPAGGKEAMTILSGNLTRTAEQSMAFVIPEGMSAEEGKGQHLVNLGVQIEKMEGEIRRDIDGLYVQKTRQILTSLRKHQSSSSQPSQGAMFTNQLNAAIGSHGIKREGGLADKIAALALQRQQKQQKQDDAES